MVLLAMPENLNFKKVKQVQGPKVNKGIKRWCSGECDGAMIPFYLALDEMPKVKLKTAEARRLNKWWLKWVRNRIKEMGRMWKSVRKDNE